MKSPHVLFDRVGVLETLEAATSRAADGAGQLVVVEAPAGMGKTSLLDRAAEVLNSRGFRVLRGCGAGLEREFAYGVVGQLLESTVAGLGDDSTLFSGTAEPARSLFGIQTSPDGVAPFAMLHALYWVVANLCQDGPLAVVVDDAHNADEPSLAFLAFLARRRRELPLQIVIATRSTDTALRETSVAELQHLADDALPLEPLSPTSIAVLCRDERPHVWGDDVIAAIATASGGNPFYVSELVRELGSMPDAQTADPGWVAGIGPAAIRRNVLSRIAAVGPGSVEVARACAVLGDGARLADCALLAGVPLEVAAHIADGLVRAGVFKPGTPGFVHPIVCSAVRSDVGDHALSLWHERAVCLLIGRTDAPRAVAVHLLQCEPADDPNRVTVLRRAAHEAMLTGTPGVAVGYLRRARAESARSSGDPQLLFDLALAEAAIGDPAALVHSREATGAGATAIERCERALVSADLHVIAAESAVGAVVLGTLFSEVADAVGAELRLRLWTKLGWLRMFDPTQQRASTYVGTDSAVVPAGLQLPDCLARRQLLGFLLVEAGNTSRASAESLLLQLMAPPGPTSFAGWSANDALFLANSLHALEFHDALDDLVESVRRDASRTGDVLSYAIIGLAAARQQLRFGRLESARAEVLAAAEAATLVGWPVVHHAFTSVTANVLMQEGRFEEAKAMVEALPAGTFGQEGTYTQAVMTDLRGQIRCGTGAAGVGLEDLKRSGAALARLGFVNPGHVDWGTHLAYAYLRTGEQALARTAAEREVADARRCSGPIMLASSLRTLAATASDVSERCALLEEARAISEGSRGRLVYASVLLDLGAAHRRQGHRVSAREYLEQALEAAAECGATGLVARAREELLASGARPRRARYSGVEALTPSETRVARHAAAGMSNTEIAQALFVTRNTVETHLAAVYRKLAIHGRAQLTDHFE